MHSVCVFLQGPYLTPMALHVPRSVPDDADPNEVPTRPRVYGGHPSPLADKDTRKRTKAMLRAGVSCVQIANELGYSSGSAFSSAFALRFGMRPSEFAKQVGAPKAKRPEGKGRVVSRKPAHTGDKPLPRFDAKKKAPKKKRPKKRAA
jgi:hypothetical protein